MTHPLSRPPDCATVAAVVMVATPKKSNSQIKRGTQCPVGPHPPREDPDNFCRETGELVARAQSQRIASPYSAAAAADAELRDEGPGRRFVRPWPSPPFCAAVDRSPSYAASADDAGLRDGGSRAAESRGMARPAVAPLVGDDGQRLGAHREPRGVERNLGAFDRCRSGIARRQFAGLRVIDNAADANRPPRVGQGVGMHVGGCQHKHGRGVDLVGAVEGE
jgi:hypothetical protein